MLQLAADRHHQLLLHSLARTLFGRRQQVLQLVDTLVAGRLHRQLVVDKQLKGSPALDKLQHFRWTAVLPPAAAAGRHRPLAEGSLHSYRPPAEFDVKRHLAI